MTEPARELQARIIEMADNITFAEQLRKDTDRVVLMNVFRAAPEDMDKVIAAWRHDALYMKVQPGFISGQLHAGHAGSNVLFNYAVWRSVADLRAAVSAPAFIEHVKAYPASSRPSPHIFRTLAIDGVCGGDVNAPGN
jgi:heme-degrading monooxygenase HmoA